MSMKRPDATGLRQSGKALEDSFFARENARLLKKMKEKEALQAKRDAFKEIANIENEELLDALIDLDIEPHEIAALNLYPLVRVAWADGEIQPKEREAIIKAAEEGGIEKGSENHDLLENWLNQKPEPELMGIWKTYAHELLARLDSVLGRELKQRMMTRTTGIAKAAGGFLGIGSISNAEQAVLDELEHAVD
jgi:tellurite resistance protein